MYTLSLVVCLSDGPQRSELSVCPPEQVTETELEEEQHEIMLNLTSTTHGMEGEMTKAGKAV